MSREEAEHLKAWLEEHLHGNVLVRVLPMNDNVPTSTKVRVSFLEDNEGPDCVFYDALVLDLIERKGGVGTNDNGYKRGRDDTKGATTHP